MSTKSSKSRLIRNAGLFLCVCVLGNLSCGEEEIKPKWHQAIDDAVKEVMDVYDVPGLSLALVKNERLVYVAAYGYSDLESGEKARVNSLCRIASISKVVTGVAILKLVKDELISLDDTVFGTEGILGTDYGTPPDGSKIDEITVRHLLNHRSGWTNGAVDPVQSYSTSTQAELITGMVTNTPLTYDPGSQGYYLNVGYLILGRVIEKISGTSYELYVKDQVLLPIGITDMRIGGNTLAQRFPNEFKYYSNGTIFNDGAYLNDVTRSDAAAGWIATATDLVRLLVHIDRRPVKEDLFSADLISQINYMAQNSWLHTGLTYGASGILTKLDDTYSLAITFNMLSHSGILEVRDAVKESLVSVTEWPDEDLF